MALSIVDQAGKSIEKPSLLCRRGGQIDGQSPSVEEIEALDAVPRVVRPPRVLVEEREPYCRIKGLDLFGGRRLAIDLTAAPAEKTRLFD